VSFASLLNWLSNWGFIVFIRDSKYGMPAVQSFHLMGLTVFLATILVLSARLAGVGMMDSSLAFLGRQFATWIKGAATLVILSGMLIFLATPGILAAIRFASR